MSEATESTGFRQRFLNFICDSPLYVSLDLDQDESKREGQIDFIEKSPFKPDIYCIYCKKNSTFYRSLSSNYLHYLAYAKSNGIVMEEEVSIQLVCLRRNDHLYKFSCLILADRVIKIGQYPSMESISGSEIEQYRSVLEKQDFSELRRAGGLASHGMGIAPYVYLRRIFERLIFQHYEEHKATNGEIEGFATKRIEDKIADLSHSLPPALLNNKAVYKILSKGIHELDEESCLKYYPVVRAVIVAILEEDLQRKAKAKAERDLRNSLAKALAELKDD